MSEFLNRVQKAGNREYKKPKPPTQVISINRDVLHDLQDFCNENAIYPRYLIEELLKQFFKQLEAK